MSGKELFSFVALVVILGCGIFIAPTISLSYDANSGVNEDFEVDEEVIEEQVEVALRCQFYENLGQVANPDVKFYGNIPGGMIGFAESRILLMMEGAESVVTLSFDDARDVVPVGVGNIGHRTSYFLGDRGTYSNIPSYSSVVYDQLWPGIDLVYHATIDGAKYEFRVAPGADPADIRVSCEGSDSLVVGTNSLRIEMGDGELIDDGLRMFQGTTDVDGAFTSLGSDVFGFSVGDYDRSKPLVIDPLVYSTYVSGASNEYGRDIVVDESGNVYVTGYTYSTDFPTVNPYDATGDVTGRTDVFVFKLSGDGRSLLYSTYVGGNRHDRGRGIAIDGSGNALVAGYTESTNFPTVNAYDATGDGTYTADIFVFKLSSDGSTLLYSTYVGGSELDFGSDLAIDSTGNVYITGYTESTDFPTVNAYDATGDGNVSYRDVIVFKLSSDGSSLLYSTYVGGSRDDEGHGIAVDSSGNAYVTGRTRSTDFPTVNAYNATGDGDTYYNDVIVFKLSSDGSSLLYSTYVSGSRHDWGYAITADSSGNVYVTGDTSSSDFPTVNAYSDTYGGGFYDCFVFKLSSDGSSLLYSTYMGGSMNDYGYDMAVDSSGNVYVTGYTSSTDFPTVNAYNSIHSGGGDVFIFKLAANGSSLFHSTFVGGSSSDFGIGIAIDITGNVYVTGCTSSTDFPMLNAYDMVGDGSTVYDDVIVFKLMSDNIRSFYSTYVSGSHNDYSYAMASDSVGNIYVTGYTTSTDFPTVNAYDSTGDGSTSYFDVFVFKLSSNGSSLLYSTYVGGSGDEIAFGIAVDSSGSAYVTGGTASTNFPAVNAYNATGNGNVDVFVFKITANGSNLIYSTYVGGSNSEIGYGIAIDNTGNAYITGYTDSVDFPTVNPFNSTGDGSTSYNDVFVFKLSSDGSSLLYSTYVSGSDSDTAYGIAIDSAGNAYVTGYTSSTDFPTMNAYDATGDGRTDRPDVFVFKLNSTGNGLLFSTYVGGLESEGGRGIVVDDSDNVYITGFTYSVDFPTVNAYDSSGDGSTSTEDVFVFKLNSTGNGLLYSTYVSGSDSDQAYGIAIDDGGNTYVTGYTQSNDFPTVNAYNSTGDGTSYWDVFVFKLAANGNILSYSTYMGGSRSDCSKAIIVCNLGYVYVTGYTRSTDFPTVNAYNTTGDGSTNYYDVFVFKLGDNVIPDLDSPVDYTSEQGSIGNQIIWTAGDRHPSQYRVDGNGTIVGWTAWSNGTISVDVDVQNLGLYNYTITVVDSWGNMVKDTVFVTVEDTTAPSLDSPDDFTFEQGTVGTNITWMADDYNPFQYRIDGNGTTVSWTTWSNGNISVIVDSLTPGVYNYTITVVDDFSQETKDTVFVTVEDTTSPSIDTPDDFTYEQGTTGNNITWTVDDLNPHQYRIDGNGTTADWTAWSSGTIPVYVDGHTLGVYNYTITIVDDYGNEAKDTVFVTVEDTTAPDLDSPDDFTYEQGTIGNNIVWTADDLSPDQYRIDGNGTTLGWTSWSSSSIIVDVDGHTPGLYNYTITVRDSLGNQATDTVFVTVEDTTSPGIDSPVDFSYEQGTTGNEIMWTVSDFNPDQYRVDGNGTVVGWTSWSSGTISINVDGYTFGVFNYTITVRDDYGNEATDTVFVAVADLTGPEISNIQHLPVAPNDESDVSITATVIDALSDVSNVRLYYRTKPEDGVWSVFTYIPMGDQGNDTYGGTIHVQSYATQVEYYVWAVDDWSNTADTSSNVGSYTVLASDTVGPVITTSHDPDSPTAIQSVVVTATVIDTSDIDEVILSYSIDGGTTWTNVTMTHLSGDEWTVTIPQQVANVMYIVFASDVFDNWDNSMTKSFTVAPADTEGPTIGLSRAPSAPTELDDVIITVTITDENEVTAATLQYSVDSGTIWTNVTMSLSTGTEWTGIIPKQAVGVEVRYRVHARDALGNWGVSSDSSFVVASSVDVVGMMLVGVEAAGACVFIYGGYRGFRRWQRRRGLGKVIVQEVK